MCACACMHVCVRCRSKCSTKTDSVASLLPCLCRPLHLPLVATVVLDSGSMSTSIVTGAPVHVVSMVLDGVYLLLTATKPTPSGKPTSQSPSSSFLSSSSSPTSHSHSVCVIEVEWLCFTLRHCNNSILNEEVQKVSSCLVFWFSSPVTLYLLP